MPVKWLRAVSVTALIFLGITSLMGSIPMIIDPSGRSLMMPQNLLEHLPFTSYRFPGIVLLCANGLLSFTVLVPVLRKIDHYSLWIVLQGCVLAGWITTQVMMIRVLFWEHYVYWIIALILIVCGLLLRNRQTRAK